MEWRDDAKNFGVISQAWRNLAAAPSREVAWWRFALAPRLILHGARRTPLLPLSYVSKVGAERIFAIALAPIVRVVRPVLYDHLVHERVIAIVNFWSDSHRNLLLAFQIGGVPCASPACKGGAKGWDTGPGAGAPDTRAPLEYIDKAGVSSGASIMRGRCKTCGMAFLCTDAVV